MLLLKGAEIVGQLEHAYRFSIDLRAGIFGWMSALEISRLYLAKVVPLDSAAPPLKAVRIDEERDEFSFSSTLTEEEQRSLDALEEIPVRDEFVVFIGPSGGQEIAVLAIPEGLFLAEASAEPVLVDQEYQLLEGTVWFVPAFQELMVPMAQAKRQPSRVGFLNE
jgi:hypothetical protein